MSAAIETATPERTYRDYSPEYKAEILALIKANNGNTCKTSEETGIARQTLDYWVKNEKRYADFQLLKQTELATKYEASIHRTVDAMLDDDLDKVSYVQKATAIGILTDKMLLLRGQPTSIVATIGHDDLSQAKQTAQQIQASAQIPLYDAAVRLAHELEDVPELAQQLRTWAESELKGQ